MQTSFTTKKNQIQLKLDGKRVQNPLVYRTHTQARRKQRVKEANCGSSPTKALTEKYGVKESFEYINVNAINAHDDFIELTNILGVLKTMGVEFFGLNEHNLNTLDQLFMKNFWKQ